MNFFIFRLLLEIWNIILSIVNTSIEYSQKKMNLFYYSKILSRAILFKVTLKLSFKKLK